MTLVYYLIVALIGFIGGLVSMFFVLKNNPKYLEVEKLGRAALEDLKRKIEEQLKRTTIG